MRSSPSPVLLPRFIPGTLHPFRASVCFGAVRTITAAAPGLESASITRSSRHSLGSSPENGRITVRRSHQRKTEVPNHRRTHASGASTGDDVHISRSENFVKCFPSVSVRPRPRWEICAAARSKRWRECRRLQRRQMLVRLLRIPHFLIDPSAENEGLSLARGGEVTLPRCSTGGRPPNFSL